MARTIEFRIGPVTTTAMIAMPDGPGPFPGAVMTFHRGGLDGFSEWVVDQLAAAGFATIAPNHYHVMPPGVDLEHRREYLTDEQYELDFRASAAWLAAQKNVDSKRLAVLGHCAGGRATWVALETCSDLWRCGCVWYGGGAMRPMGKLPSPFDRLNLIACPVAGFFGDKDGNPSPADVDKFDAALTKFGVPHEFHRYAEAGHGFMNHENYSEAAAKASWAKALAFLRRHCG